MGAMGFEGSRLKGDGIWETRMREMGFGIQGYQTEGMEFEGGGKRGGTG